jgi:hypothetical protein
LRVNNDSQPYEYAPLFCGPPCMEDQESVLGDPSSRFIAVDYGLEPPSQTRGQIHRRNELFFPRLELPMRQSHRNELKRRGSCILDLPYNVPTARRVATHGNLSDSERRSCEALRSNLPVLLKPPFGPELLLRKLQNPVVDHSVQGEFAVNETGANVFLEHLLKP